MAEVKNQKCVVKKHFFMGKNYDQHSVVSVSPETASRLGDFLVPVKDEKEAAEVIKALKAPAKDKMVKGAETK